MKNKKLFISIKTKIMLSTLIPVALSFFLICSVIFTSLFNSLHEIAKTEFVKISKKYAISFETEISSAMNYLSIIASTLEMQVKTGVTDREMLQKTVFNIFSDYGLIDGSSIYFEPDMYDGKDAEYAGSHYGTPLSGRICYYFYKDDGKTAYLPEALGNDMEFSLPHYTKAKEENKPVYTKPVIYEVDGRAIPMFTLTYPVYSTEHIFIGAVTVDLFLDTIYTQIQNEKIYKTGYLVIANDSNQVIYSPHFKDIGKTRAEVGFQYDLPPGDESPVFFNAKSIINGKDTLIAIETIYIPQLDSRFYVSAAAPTEEINAGGYRLMTALIALSIIVAAGFSLLLYYLIGRISAPLKEITESANNIAKGDYGVRIQGDYKNEFAIVKDSVNAMADSIELYVNNSRNSLNILKNILNGLDAFIYVTNPANDEILFINEKMKEHFNIIGSILGRHCYEILQEGIHERCEFCPCHQLDKEPDNVFVWEEHNTITNRDYRNTDCYIEWLGGTKVHLQHSVDITDLKTYRNDKLTAERKVLEFKHKKEEAESAAKAKNDFLAKMSHEIRTPMNAITGMTELILRKELPQDIYENAQMIKSASFNLLSIINDILDFSKIESGKLEIIETDYLLPALINDVVNVIRIRLLDKPIHFVVNIDPSVPFSLMGDEIRIRQILTNLLSNAVKYTNTGYISLDISGISSTNTVTLTVKVSDSGVGIKKKNIDKLFGDFVQLDEVNNRGIEGTGLGLAITRNLCRLMGGDITVQSTYGKGSVFTAILPQKFEVYQPFAAVDNTDGKSVLLYETRQIYRESIIRALQDLGIEYLSTKNIPSLFDNLEKYPYVFVSSFAYSSISPVLSMLSNSPKLVLLSDITETYAPKNAVTLPLPAHALSIANILNDIEEDYDRMPVTGASFMAPDAKILIVDDIMTNLKVGEGLLLPYEVQVTLCSSGQKAIELVAQNHYDLVFMDHMMPEMDGLEATRHIREMDEDYFKALPIIALTANAVSGVKEMFIQNGMNDFLSKPIETAKLDAILEKWIPKDKRKKKTASGEPDEKSGFVDLLRTVPDLSVSKALSMVGNSETTYERIVRLSIRLLSENIARLNSLIDTDLPNYAIEVHGIKGVLNNMGAYELGLKALELENLSRNGDWDASKEFHPEFAGKLTEFSDAMNLLISKTETLVKSEGDLSLLRDVLDQLTEAVDFYDSIQALKILSSIDSQTFGQDLDTMIDQLTHALECFDFDKAGELTEKLIGEVK